MIGYYLHHQGSGHRRRATAIARRLRHEVTGLGSGGAPEGWPGRWIELARDDEPPVDGLADESADVTAKGVLHWVPRQHPGLLQRHRQIVNWLSQERPSLVVVDVSVEVSLLVRLCGIPVVVGGMPGERTDEVHALAYDLAEAILAPWPPGAHPNSGWPERWTAKTWEVGGISALADTARSMSAPAGRVKGKKALVVWGSGGDDLDPAALAAAQAATPGWSWTVRGGGQPASTDLLAEVRAADVVVCHAGQGAVADVAYARRPAVVVSQPRPYDEQEATADALGRLGLAAVAEGWPDADRWPALLDRALAIGGEGWSAWVGEGPDDGPVSAAVRLDALADRLTGAAPGGPPVVETVLSQLLGIRP